MTLPVEQADDEKISAEFASRLARLQSDVSIRAIVLPVTRRQSRTDKTMTRRALREERIAYNEKTVDQAFCDIDELLAGSGGCRLTQQSNTLGFIVIEATPSAIESIANLEWVAAVVEDQPVYSLDEVETRPTPKPQRFSWNNLSSAHT